MKERLEAILLDEYPMSENTITNIGEDGCAYIRVSRYSANNGAKGSITVAGIIKLVGSRYEILETVVSRVEK